MPMYRLSADRLVDVVKLPQASQDPHDADLRHINKVLTLVFSRDAAGGYEFLLMQPQKNPAGIVGTPQFQVPKGTRRVITKDGLEDMGSRTDGKPVDKDAAYEPPLTTSLRETREEVGLSRGNVKRVYDLGMHKVLSRTQGKEVDVYIYAAEVKNRKRFEPYEPQTAAVKWIKAAEMDETIRPDHQEIIREMEARLKHYHSQEKDKKSR